MVNDRLDIKVKDLVLNEDNQADIELSEEITKEIKEMIEEFDASDSKSAISGVKIKYFYIDNECGWAEIYAELVIGQATISQGFRGDYWNPPENHVSYTDNSQGFEFNTENVDGEMTVKDVITSIAESCWNCNDFVKELRDLTKDIDGDVDERDYYQEAKDWELDHRD